MSKKSHASTPRFVISLDFELMWGVRDHKSIQSYGRNILGARTAIPAMLKLFEKHQVRATWGTVGMLLFEDKKSLLDNIPSIQPSYLNPRLSPYHCLAEIGNNEKEDPYHYALSLAREIVAYDGMELASHTFSHYYCLERGQSDEQFGADLDASVAACYRVSGVRPASLIFPRNQYEQSYLPTCEKKGFKAFRGNEKSWVYSKSEKKDSSLKRFVRLADSMLNITGDHVFLPRVDHGLLNIPASRFLRPYSKSLSMFAFLQCRRIMQSMTVAAATGTTFHLWWHPHNYGMNLDENISMLNVILNHLQCCREDYGMMSCNMGDLCR